MAQFASCDLTVRVEDTLAACPYYQGTGRCTGMASCSSAQEPICITNEPSGGWESWVRAQYNEPNPILVNLRQRIATGFDDVEEFAWWLENEYNHDTDSWVWEDDSITESHVAHARRVLSRLATLTEGGAAS